MKEFKKHTPKGYAEGVNVSKWIPYKCFTIIFLTVTRSRVADKFHCILKTINIHFYFYLILRVLKYFSTYFPPFWNRHGFLMGELRTEIRNSILLFNATRQQQIREFLYTVTETFIARNSPT